MAGSTGSPQGRKKKRGADKESDSENETDTSLNKEEACEKCSKKVKDQDLALQCERCNKWHHIGCVGVSKKAYEYLKELETTMWFCKSCYKKTRQEKEDITTMKENVKQIKEDVKSIKSTLTSGYVTPAAEARHAEKQNEEMFSNDLGNRLHDVLEEREEREKRKLNLVVHGLTETWPDGEPIDDKEAFKALCKDTLKVSDVKVTATVRLGARNPPAGGRKTQVILIMQMTSQDQDHG